MKKTLVTGSMAYDTITVFEDRFKNHILPDQIHILNVCFLVPEMTRHRGGCAGNIAYSLKLLGGEPLIMATVGEDFGSYARYLDEVGLDRRYVREVQDTFTAQAYFTTDLDNNQIINFHPGAMNHAHLNSIGDVEDEIELAIIGPNGKDAMIAHSKEMSAAGMPFIFDPGQQLPLFDGEECSTFLEQATYAIVNDYESELLLSKTELTLEQVADKLDALIVTRGGEGSQIFVNGERIDIGVAPISKAVDPTGCGDAYRAGVMHGLTTGQDWQTAGQMGAVCGAIQIEHGGTQSHAFSPDEFAQRYKAAFSEDLFN